MSLRGERAAPNVIPFNLPMVDTYIGLQDLKRTINVTYEKSLRIERRPQVMAQISSKYPGRVSNVDPARHLDINVGTVSPDSKKFVLESNVS